MYLKLWPCKALHCSSTNRECKLPSKYSSAECWSSCLCVVCNISVEKACSSESWKSVLAIVSLTPTNVHHMHAMLTLTSNAYCIIYVIVMQNLDMMVLVVLHELYYILCMNSYTSCQLMNCKRTSLAYTPCMAAMWMLKLASKCLF